MACIISCRLLILQLESRLLQMQLRELVYAAAAADNICLLASSLTSEQLQALIGVLATYCAAVRMETSVLKTKVTIVSAVPAPYVTFTCDGNPAFPSVRLC